MGTSYVSLRAKLSYFRPEFANLFPAVARLPTAGNTSTETRQPNPGRRGRENDVCAGEKSYWVVWLTVTTCYLCEVEINLIHSCTIPIV